MRHLSISCQYGLTLPHVDCIVTVVRMGLSKLSTHATYFRCRKAFLQLPYSPHTAMLGGLVRDTGPLYPRFEASGSNNPTTAEELSRRMETNAAQGRYTNHVAVHRSCCCRVSPYILNSPVNDKGSLFMHLQDTVQSPRSHVLTLF